MYGKPKTKAYDELKHIRKVATSCRIIEQFYAVERMIDAWG